MLLVIHRYFALPDRTDELLALRVRLSAGLRSLGLTAGQVGVRRYGEYPPGNPPGSGPDVVKVFAYPTVAELQRWGQRQEDSAAFRAVMEDQRGQVDRFEREGYAIVDPVAGVFSTNRYYAKPGMAERVLATRLRGDAVCKELGIPPQPTAVRSGPGAEDVAPGDAPPDVAGLATFADADDYRREREAAHSLRCLQELAQQQTQLLAGDVVEVYTIVGS
jgi:hypothetical protein